jgi:hypothetical protein
VSIFSRDGCVIWPTTLIPATSAADIPRNIISFSFQYEAAPTGLIPRANNGSRITESSNAIIRCALFGITVSPKECLTILVVAGK